PAGPAPKTKGVTSIAYKEAQSILTVSSPRMFAQSGFLAQIFDTIAKRGVVVDMVATSEISVSFTAAEPEALKRVAEEFKGLGECSIASGKTILAVVGHHLPARAGI